MKTKDWTENIPYELIWIQGFHGGGDLKPPMCDKCHSNRSVGMWMNRERKGFCLCSKCSSGAESPIEGVCYRPEASK